MKKFYYLLASIATILVIVVACEKSSIEVEELQALQDIELSAKGDKVDICHWDAELGVWVAISIAPEAVDKHMLNHGDKFPYSPEGDYSILRDNGAVLNITIDAAGNITGSGYTSNGPGDPQTYTGTATVYQDHTALLVVPQSPQGGTHYIDAIVSECDGITGFTNDYSLIP
jgi:hypothetical protein